MPRVKRWFRRLVAVWCFGPVCALAAEDWHVRGWHLEDGLPDGTITAMAQGPDGCLWLGTPSGVVRFDGARFRRAEKVPEREIAGLAFDSNGGLWTIGKSGRVYFYQHGNNWFGGGNGTGDANPLLFPPWFARSSLTPAKEGGMWLRTEGAEAVRLTADGPRDAARWPGVAQGSVLAEASGAAWAVRGNQVRRFNGRQWEAVRIGPPEVAVQEPVCADPTEGIWVLAADAAGLSLCHLSGANGSGRRIAVPAGVGSATKPVSAVLRDRRGGFWLSDWWGGIWHGAADGGWNQIIREGPLRHCVVTCLLEDRQGAVWAGTLGEGLHRIAPHVAKMVAPSGTGGRMSVTGVCGDPSGRLWFGVEGDGVYCHDDGGLRRYGATEGLTSKEVGAVFADRGGRIWAGTSAGAFLLTNERFERVDVPSGGVITFCEDRQGGLWMGGHEGTGALWHLAPGGRWTMLRPSDAGVLLDIRGITEDAAGTVWVAAFGTGLWRVGKESLEPAHGMSGWSHDDLRSIHADSRGGLWLGTLYGGLWHWQDGKLAHLSRADGLPDDSILGIADDGRGGLWFSSSNGVFGCARDALTAHVPGGPPLLCRRVMPEDGLGNRGCSGGGQPVIARLGEDALCVANMIGVAIIRPGEVAGRGAGAEVKVEAVLADGEPLEAGNPVLTAPASVRRFEFEYAAPDLADARSQRFRHRLEPLDRDWLDAGSERSAAYSRLAPGTYQFRVMVGGADGVWREAVRPVVLRVTPRFWQTRWFAPVGVAAAVALLGIWGVWRTRSRMRRKMEVLEMGHAVERERARIARDIHDDLGTNLTEILMISEAESEEPADAARRLRRIGGKTRSMIQALDEIVWAVGPANDNLPKLADYLCAVSEELCESAGVRCWHEVPPDLPMLPLAVDYRHQVFLAVKEAFNNALKHAKATEVWLVLQLARGELRIEVRDNGCGISSGGTGPPGNGLTNMRARIEALGGRMEIRSEPAAGTTVSFAIPLPG